MTVTDPKRAQKLVSFREVERDRAGMALTAAKTMSVSAEEAVTLERVKLEAERAKAARGCDQGFQSEEMQLALACVEATREDLKQKEEMLSQAVSEVNAKTAVLLNSHKRMRQMEALLKQAEKGASKIARVKEQREIDDLATNKGARK